MLRRVTFDGCAQVDRRSNASCEDVELAGSIAPVSADRGRPMHLRIWVYDGVLASGIAGTIDLLATANLILKRGNGRPTASPARFTWRIESLDGKPVCTASGQIVNVDGPITGRGGADAIIVMAPFVEKIETFLEQSKQSKHFKPLFAALKRSHVRGAVIASYCTGSFLLAEAGLLDGRIATTHWANAKVFEKRYPLVDLRASEVLTEQDRIVCGGAVTSSLKLALRLVEKLAGAAVATATAKLLLIDTGRVSQTPHAPLQKEGHTDKVVARAQRWMENHLHERFLLAELATHLAVSERTLNRRFKSAVGDAPLRYLQTLRIEMAKQLLERRADISVERVSERIGYRDVSTFRQLFRRSTGHTPRDYQRRFARRKFPPAKSRWRQEAREAG
jgi:transcriptional regulator GlxA family with amidase domain